MRALAVSDLHLTDHARDEYRWRVFTQLAELSQLHGYTDLLVLGDLTEYKDYHSSKLVNRVVESFYHLRKSSRIAQVHFLKGNHDGLDPEVPYFRFMRRIPWASVYVQPTYVDLGKDTLLFLPHTRDPESDWAGIEMAAEYIFLHGTMKGSVSESGQKLDGISSAWFKGLRSCILAGDIHVPQKIGNVEYVGAPYPIRFGDTFQPRVLGLQEGKRVSHELRNIRKVTIEMDSESMTAVKLRRGDQVKCVITLAPSELGMWQALKVTIMERCKKIGATLVKVQLNKKTAKALPLRSASATVRTIEEEFSLYCKLNKEVDEELRGVGEALMEDEA